MIFREGITFKDAKKVTVNLPTRGFGRHYTKKKIKESENIENLEFNTLSRFLMRLSNKASSIDLSFAPEMLIIIGLLFDMPAGLSMFVWIRCCINVRYIACCLFILAIGLIGGLAQSKLGKGELTLSIPFVWNRYHVINVIGPVRAIEGQGWSHGINLAYSRYVDRNFFLIGGLGYYNQKFYIHRPFDYPSKTFQLFTTKFYSYQTLQWILGAGGNIPIGGHYHLRPIISFNQFNTFRQLYIPESASPKLFLGKHHYFGNSILLSLGLYRKLSDHWLAGLNGLVSLETAWRKDMIFREDPRESNHSNSGYGLSFSVVYQF